MAEASGSDKARRDVGLALRAHRRQRGQSQRAYAKDRGLSRDVLARAEVDAGALSLAVLIDLLDGTGFGLTVRSIDDRQQRVEWEETDLLARTRSGSRFPAHRSVRESRGGPKWWIYHEFLGNRAGGEQPKWTAEGFTPPAGTRYGRRPRPFTEEEGPRWPY